jgi:serine/threonine protein kinase
LKEEGVVSVQTDMWGLGIISFTLLAGFHAFSSEDDTDAEVRENVLKQKCDPNLIPVQASQEALRFATWALKKDPNRRMRTDEALSHRFLANDSAMVRRRENIRYPSQRLQKTALRTMKRPSVMMQMSALQPFSTDANMDPFAGAPKNGMPMPPNGFPQNRNARKNGVRNGRPSAEV